MAAWLRAPSRGSGGHAAFVFLPPDEDGRLSTPLPSPEVAGHRGRARGAALAALGRRRGVRALADGRRRRARRGRQDGPVARPPRAPVARRGRPGRSACSPSPASPSRASAAALERDGIETIAVRPPRPGAGLARCPASRTSSSSPGRKFGSTGRPDLTWAQNVIVPSIVAPHFAGGRIVVFSSGNVYPLVPPGVHRVDRNGPGRPGGGIRADLRRPRARLRARLARAGHAVRPLPPLLRRRPALRHARGRGAQGPRRRARGSAGGPRQRPLAGRRELVCLSRALALRDAAPAAGGDGARASCRCATRRRSSAQRFGASGPLRAASPARPSSATRRSACRCLGPPEVGLAQLIDWVARLGRARRPQPGQAHALRGDRWPLLRPRSRFARPSLEGQVIPAHPLALTAERRLDERRQVALTRYYCRRRRRRRRGRRPHDAVRDPRSAGLLEPVLRLAADVVARDARRATRPAARHGRGRRRPDAAGRARRPSSPATSATTRPC